MAKGRIGKSTTIVHLAVLFAERGMRVLHYMIPTVIEVPMKIRESKLDIILGTLNEERLVNNLQIPFLRISAPMR